MYKNIDYIYDAIIQLEQLAGVTADIESNRDEYDAIATINNTQFVVIVKSEIRASNWGIVLGEIDNLQKKTRKPIIAIAKFITSEIAKQLKEKGINYIDRAGNAYIKQGKLLIYISGQKSKKPTNFNQSRAFQESGIKLLFHLLTQPEDLQLSYRSLSKKTGIALGSISNVMKELEDLNFILKTKSKRVLKNMEELMNRWIVAYNDILRPRILKKRMRLSIENYNKWDTLPIQDIEDINLWGGEPAAAIITGQLHPEKFTIYTNGSWQNIAKEFKLIPDENGDVEILSLFWDEDNTLHEYNITPKLLVYADLISSGFERNLQIAKIILEDELQHIK